jgi:hypothetical protein
MHNPWLAAPWLAAALLGSIAAGGGAQAQTVVNNWPTDVPCADLTNNGDGTYTLTQDVVVGNDASNVMAAGNTFSTTDEYHVWAVNCP